MRRAGRRAIGVLITVTILAAATTTADAAASRAEYVAQVDPICRAAGPPVFKAFVQYSKAAQRKRVTNQNDPKLVGPAVRFFADLERIYGGLTSSIATVPPAPGDETIVAAWLQARETVRQNLDRARRLAKNRNLKRANRLTGRAGWGKASNIVSAFGFKYCAPPDSEIVVF
jgi:hypothetical protein